MYWCTLDGLNSLSRNQKSSPLQIHQRSMGSWPMNEYAYIIGHNYCFESLGCFGSKLVCLFASYLLNNSKVKKRHGIYMYINICQVSCSFLSIKFIFYLLLPCANLPLRNNSSKHELGTLHNKIQTTFQKTCPHHNAELVAGWWFQPISEKL